MSDDQIHQTNADIMKMLQLLTALCEQNRLTDAEQEMLANGIKALQDKLSLSIDYHAHGQQQALELETIFDLLLHDRPELH